MGRYTHRVAISNERILGMEGSIVRFRVRDSANGNCKKVMRMEAGGFVDRFMQHALPGGFKRIRHYGLIGPARKTAHLAVARAALEAPAPDPVCARKAASVKANQRLLLRVKSSASDMELAEW